MEVDQLGIGSTYSFRVLTNASCPLHRQSLLKSGDPLPRDWRDLCWHGPHDSQGPVEAENVPQIDRLKAKGTPTGNQ